MSMHILGSEGEPIDTDSEDFLEMLYCLQKADRQEDQSGPCDDDCEKTAPWIDGMPDEKDYFLSKPLSFKGDYEWAAEELARKDADERLLNALYQSDMDDMIRRRRRAMTT